MQFLDNVWLVISRNAEHVAAIIGIMWLGTKFIPVLSGWIDRLASKPKVTTGTTTGMAKTTVSYTAPPPPPAA